MSLISTHDEPGNGHTDRMSLRQSPPVPPTSQPLPLPHSPPATSTSPAPLNGASAAAGAPQQSRPSSLVLSNIMRAHRDGGSVTPASPGQVSTGQRPNSIPLQNLFQSPPQSPIPVANLVLSTVSPSLQPQFPARNGFGPVPMLNACMPNGQPASLMGYWPPGPQRQMTSSGIGNGFAPQAVPVRAESQRNSAHPKPVHTASVQSSGTSALRGSVFRGEAAGSSANAQYFDIADDGALRAESASIYSESVGGGESLRSASMRSAGGSIARASIDRESQKSKESKHSKDSNGSKHSKDSKHSKASKSSESKQDKSRSQEHSVKGRPPSASANRLPMIFLCKYLGHQKLVRRPGESTSAVIGEVAHELLVAATELPDGDDAPLVVVTVSDTAIEMKQHANSKHRGPPQRGQVFPIDFVSHAGQDNVYHRVMSFVFISEVNARFTTCECHAFCLANELSTKRFAFAVNLAFQALMRRVQMGSPMQMGLSLQNPRTGEHILNEDQLTNSISEDATEA